MSIDYDPLRMAATVAQLARALDQLVRQQGEDGLGLAELSVLRQVERGVNLPSKVARALRLDPGRVTRLVDRLVEMGYICRGPDEEDRRRSRLSLTREGTERLRSGRGVVAAVTMDFLAPLTQEERDSLARGLDAVRQVLASDTTQAVFKE